MFISNLIELNVKKNTTERQESSRKLRLQWKSMQITIKKHSKKPDVIPTYGSLFDIGKDMATVTGRELLFYKDQQTERECRLSEEVDEDFEIEREISMELEQSLLEEEENSFINDPEFEENIDIQRERTMPSNRVMTVSKEVQVCISDVNQPEIRKVRNTSDKIRNTIATVSYRSGISVPKARIAVQAVCEILYGHKYYLSVAAQPCLSTIQEDNEPEEPKSKKTRTKEDYMQYKDVLPDAKAVNDYKHKKALHQEIEAANALVHKRSTSKVTLHYDTTSRSRIDGEWPCIILNFNDDNPEFRKMLPLRPLFFALENREQITKLIIETLKRLSAATENAYSAKYLWEKIDAFMTDAVSKNLKVEEEVSKQLESSHLPLHLLCKSHTCEKFDETNIKSLGHVENIIGLREKIEKREPRLKSFLRQKKCIITDAVIPALLKLVAKDADGKTSSLADEFALILEEDGIYKTYSLYKERRFSKLGYSAGSIFDSIPQFRKLLERTSYNNLLVRGCRVYLESDFILAGLKALSNFTYFITMPFLNAVERCNQDQLVEILPNLHKELESGILHNQSLKEFMVPWTHVAMKNQVLTTELDHYLIKQMCTSTASGLEMQCAGEYWADDVDLRATAIHKLTPAERKNIPTENLLAERYLAKSGQLISQSAKHSNKFFKAKRIKDDLMFTKHLEEPIQINSTTAKKIYEILDQMEEQWNVEQKAVFKDKVKKSFEKSKRTNEFIDILLKKCKEHQGPFVTLTELESFVSTHVKEDVKKSLRTEIQFQRETHPKDYAERADLYKINCMTTDQLIINLTTLLAGDTSNEEDADVVFESHEEVMHLLQSLVLEDTAKTKFNHQQPLIVIWDDASGRNWHLGFYLDENDDGVVRIDHLERLSKNDDVHWKRPKSDDVQDVLLIQILSCKVDGEWNFEQRKPVYVIKNIDEISNLFCEL